MLAASELTLGVDVIRDDKDQTPSKKEWNDEKPCTTLHSPPP